MAGASGDDAAITAAGSPEDPATVDDYDYTGGEVARPDLVDALQERVAGDVRFDRYSRELYATDASIYRSLPVGVVFPQSTDDVVAVMAYCAAEEVPVLPRGGGTSLAGQTVNEAVVLDFTRYMDTIHEVDPDAGVARAEPGAILERINEAAAPHGLKFAPDPAWGDKSALGGAIGNNSTGAHSLKYGKTDAYLEEVEVVLADGTRTTFGEESVADLRERGDPEGDVEARIAAAVARIVDEEADAVADAFPDIKRAVSGYNLDRIVDEARGEARSSVHRDEPQAGTVNLAHLLAGSEGTLGIVTAAEIGLVPVPETKSMALLSYHDRIDAMADVAPILEHDPAAVEVLDDVLLDLARDTDAFGDLVRDLLPVDAGAVLLVEFYADDEHEGKQAVSELIADRAPDQGTSSGVGMDRATTDAPQRAIAVREAHDADTRKRFWKLRKSGLPILLSRTTDAKHIAFIEDTAIPPDRLPEYVADFTEILEAHDTNASFYAHAGPGVLHIRPLVDTKTEAGLETVRSIADQVTDLVVEYGGSVSGEHGDGRARSRWNEKLYGQALWDTFRDLKTAFDPDWLLNPGMVCGDPDDEGPDPTANLRFDPDYGYDAPFDPALEWDIDNGMQGMVELCHGCGGCRGDQSTTGGVMCPTYRAADEEITATRGRANLLRSAMSGELPPDEVLSEEFRTEVLDLCIGCKGCKHDCPSEVDMAKLKAEVDHAAHQRDGASLRERLFANVDRLAALGSATAPLSNWLASAPGAGLLREHVLGIAPERSLPSFRRRTARDRFADFDRSTGPDAAHRAILFADTYTNYAHPEIAMAAARVLDAAGVHVEFADHTDSGRPAHSTGFLDRSRATAEEVVDTYGPRLADDWSLVAVEPSDAVMFQSDYRDLLGDDASPVSANAYGLCEYLDRFDLVPGTDSDIDGSLTYHGHCHQTATGRDHHAVGVLRRAGYDVDPLDSGCCGMAGSFGYEAEHYGMSQAIASILVDQVADADGDRVVAPGTSCRTQLGEREETSDRPLHPAEALADAL
jgi:FAD/FMN-containing dehydrogenase/Fe-S oxidoreductase